MQSASKPGFQLSNPDGLLIRTLDGENVVLCEPLVFIRKSGVAIVLPIGSRSDGPSIPKFCHAIVSKYGPQWLAGVLHDGAYRLLQLPKDECDLLILEALELQGVSWVERKVIYDAVRGFGQSAFDEDRKAQR